MSDLISRADAIEAFENKISIEGEANAYKFGLYVQGVMDKIKALPSADAVPQSEQYKKGFEDCKRAYEIELARSGDRELANLKEEFESADSEQGVGRYENAMQKLREMPRYLNGVKEKQITKISADAVQGEWEHWGSPFSDESEVIDTVVCSVCGTRFIEPKDEPKGEYNFCPNCGARMTPYKGGDDE